MTTKSVRHVGVGGIVGVLLLCAGCGPKPPVHGVELVVQVDTSALANPSEQTKAFQQTVDNLRRRLDRFGTRKLFLESTPTNTILIRYPASLAAAEIESARRQIQKRGHLEFRLVHEDSEGLVARGETPAGYQLLELKDRLRQDRVQVERLLLKNTPESGFTGTVVKQAAVTRGSRGEPEISFTLTPEGTAAFAAITKANIGRRLAILVDGEIYSAPRVMAPIEQGAGIINGQFDAAGAFELATLMENPLPAPVAIVGERSF